MRAARARERRQRGRFEEVSLFGTEDDEEQDVSEKAIVGDRIGLDRTRFDGNGGDSMRLSSEVRGNLKGRVGLEIPPLAPPRVAGTRAGLWGECMSKKI